MRATPDSAPTFEDVHKHAQALLDLTNQIESLQVLVARFYPGFKLGFIPVSVAPVKKEQPGLNGHSFHSMSGPAKVDIVLTESGAPMTMEAIIMEVKERGGGDMKPDSLRAYLSRGKGKYERVGRGTWMAKSAEADDFVRLIP